MKIIKEVYRPIENSLTSKNNSPHNKFVSTLLNGDCPTLRNSIRTNTTRANKLTALLTIILLFTANVSIAQYGDTIKLNGSLQPQGSVVTYQVSPNGNYVVYTADQDSDNVLELYSVRTDGRSNSVKLNSNLIANGGIGYDKFSISEDSTMVVYMADQDTDNDIELYSVPITGGTVEKLNNNVITTVEDVESFSISPDSSRVVYKIGSFTSGYDIYSTPINGGQKTRLNPVLMSFATVVDFQISPDSSHVVYMADPAIDNTFDIFSVPIGGGTSEQLSTANNTPFTDVKVYKISPDSSRVVYGSDQDTNNIVELFSVPITGGTITKLHSTLSSGIGVGVFEISDDSSQVVFLMSLMTGAQINLYRSAINNNTALQISQSLQANGTISKFIISPNSARVVFQADADLDEVKELYSVSITGGVVTKLNPGFSGQTDTLGFQISPDSNTVFYRANPKGFAREELFKVDITGGNIVELITSTAIGLGINSNIEFSGNNVIVLGSLNSTSTGEAYLLSANGSSPKVINGNMVTGGNVGRITTTPDGKYAIYSADQDTDNVTELYLRGLIEDELCLPIKARNENITVICL